MKDQFLYTSTYLKGLEVIDLNQAVAEYQSVFSSNPSQFGQAVSTEGNGLARETVVNTIPLYATNFTVKMYDLKGADDVPGPAVTETRVLATARLPLGVADPQKPGPNGVLYPPADITNPTVSSGLPGAGLPNLDASPLQSVDGKFQLRQGRAFALGTLPLTDSQGNSAPEQAAIIVGTGVAVLPDGTPAPGVLAVVNVNDPKHPMAQGFVGLTAFPTDVVFKGTIAIISTGANKILLVNLNDPTHPANAGEIDPSSGSVFGDRLPVTDDGLIVTSSFNSTIGGVHTSSFGVVPQIAVDPGGLLATPDGKTNQDIPINYKIFEDLTQVASPQVQLKDDTGRAAFSTA